MTVAQMKERLQMAYPDGQIEVVDLTGTMDHWQVAIASQAFKGLSRLQQQRHVMDVFQPELKTGEVHALTIKTMIKEGP
jgi:stress-induced morphogen